MKYDSKGRWIKNNHKKINPAIFNLKPGEANIRWKGGISVTKAGMRYGTGENRGRFVHTVVIEKLSLEGNDPFGWKGKLPRNWFVHFLDGNKENVEPSNLLVVPVKLHNKLINQKYRKAKIQEFWNRERARKLALKS